MALDEQLFLVIDVEGSPTPLPTKASSLEWDFKPMPLTVFLLKLLQKISPVEHSTQVLSKCEEKRELSFFFIVVELK